MKMKIRIEFICDFTTNGDTESYWYEETVPDVERAFILQELHGTPYIFNWDAITKVHYKKFKNKIQDFEIY